MGLHVTRVLENCAMLGNVCVKKLVSTLVSWSKISNEGRNKLRHLQQEAVWKA